MGPPTTLPIGTLHVVVDLSQPLSLSLSLSLSQSFTFTVQQPPPHYKWFPVNISIRFHSLFVLCLLPLFLHSLHTMTSRTRTIASKRTAAQAEEQIDTASWQQHDSMYYYLPDNAKCSQVVHGFDLV
jgi:hypothetical protein